MRFSVLGPLEAEHDGRHLQLGSVRQRAVLAILLLNGNQVVPRDRLLDELWPQGPPETAPKIIQSYVSQLRRVLADGSIRTHPSGYSIEVGDDSLDSERFERLVVEARQELAAGRARSAVERLDAALSMWRGPALQGLGQPFAVAEAARLEELRAAADEARIEADLALGRHASVISRLEALVAEHPLREGLRASQMLALYRCGRQAEALAAYRDLRVTLVRELGLEPSPALRDLERRILEQDGSLDPPGSGADGDRADSSTSRLQAPPSAIRYADNGGVSLAYEVFGEGELDLLLVTGWVLPMELVWDDPAYVRFLERLGEFSRVILWDKRGTGLSDRFPPGRLPTLEQRMEDLGVVMDAAGSDRAAIFGISEGSALAALFAATHPDRTRALVLYGGWARTLRCDGYPGGYDAATYDALVEHMRSNWNDPSTFLGLWAPSAVGDPRVRALWSRALRLGASPAAALDWLRLVRDVDIRDVLPAIDVPTLVTHRAEDHLVPNENSRYMAHRIRRATYAELAGEDHLWWLGDSDALVDAVERFLTEAPETWEPERILATVVVGVPAAGGSESQGAAAWAELIGVRGLAVHEAPGHVRVDNAGRAGERLLATFPAPSRAIRFADAIRSAARANGIRLGLGVHSGECEVAGGVAGVAVDIAAALASIAAADEILVSNTVEDLVAGSDIRFADRGSHRLPSVGERRVVALAAA